jgi:hypothetical protein
MRTFGRLLAVGAICGGALGLAAVPASALVISVGGSNPTLPLPLPLPVSVAVGVDSGGVQAGVQAPGSTDVSVKADPSGLHAKATVGNQPIAGVDAKTPTVTVPPVPGSASVPGVPTVNAPPANDVPANTPAVAPDQRVAGNANAHAAAAPRVAHEGTASIEQRDLRDAKPLGDRTADVSAEIASKPSSGLLNAAHGTGARILLWIALAGAVLAFRMFVGSSTTKATRAG